MATILVVDDNESLRVQAREILTHAALGLTVLEADNGARALPIALSGRVDLVLSDVVMPELDGIGLLRAIRQQRDAESLPVILVTAQQEGGARELGFEVGASDYLTRPFSSVELVARIQVQLRLLAMQEELRRASERYEQLSTRDELTGLANRRFFVDACGQELSRCHRHKLCFTVAVFDIDHLKAINQRVGHRAGDALIAEVGEAVRRHLRQDDTLAHVAGGKFAMLLPHTDAAQGRLASERLCLAVAAAVFSSHPAGPVTVSVGASSYPAGGVDTIEALMNAAESCLDRARGEGGNRAVSADSAGP